MSCICNRAFANNYFRAAFATSVFGGGLSTGVYVDGELKQKYRLRKNDGIKGNSNQNVDFTI